MWEERVEATIYTCANTAIADQTRKLIKKQEKSNISNDSLMNIVNKDSSIELKIENGKFLKTKTTWLIR
ncbi:MAG: hypothetical protein IPP56_03150 [Bacteroidetes bacterium]|nr:hypothetical protein [Bacteroidota bacterium]